MANIVKTSMTGTGSRAVSVTTLGASDTLIFDSSKSPVIILKNGTAGALTPNIDGADGTTVTVAGIGVIDVSAGFTLPSIAAGATVALPLNTINEYLKGVVTVTGGTGIEASILEF